LPWRDLLKIPVLAALTAKGRNALPSVLIKWNLLPVTIRVAMIVGFRG
jgi:hypothetical protein